MSYNLSKIVDYLMKHHLDKSDEFGMDGLFTVAYDGPNISANGGQPGVIGSLVDKHGKAIYLYPTNVEYPHYTITDNNIHYTPHKGVRLAITNPYVLTWITKAQAQDGGQPRFNPWLAFLKEYTEKHGVTYKVAMSKKREYNKWKNQYLSYIFKVNNLD